MRRHRPRRGVRSASVAAALTAGALTSNVLALGALTAVVPGVHLLPTRARAAQAAAPAPPHRAADPAPAVAQTPAGRVLTATLDGDPATLLGPGFSAATPQALLFGSPFAHGCGRALPAAAAPLLARSRTGHGPAGSVVLSLAAYPAGQGTLARQALRTQMLDCAGADGVSPLVAAGGPGDAAGFTAVDQVGAQGTVWVVWQRGDVLASVTLASLSGASPAAARALSGRLDTLLRAQLAPACPDLSPALSDAHRNPYSTAGYRPYARTLTVALPALTPAATPAAAAPVPVSLPAPVPHPSLAPPLPAPTSADTGSTGGGTPASPPPLSAATPGPAPVFRDAAAITIPPDLPSTEPSAPERPLAPATSATVAVPQADPTGPGCGWAFTGTPAPAFDAAALAAQDASVLAQALAAQTAAAAAFTVADQSWVVDYRAFTRAEAGYLAYRQLADAQDQARADAAAAQAAYDAAVRADSTPTPPPTATAAPGPVPAPTNSPTAAPSPAPTPTGTPTATPTATATATPTATATATATAGGAR